MCEVNEFEGEGSGLVVPRVGYASIGRPTGREQHAGPGLPLQETNDSTDPLWIPIAHVQRHGLSTACDHHIIGVRSRLQACFDEFSGQVDAERRMSEPVVGNDNNVGLVGKTKLPQPVEQQANLAVIVSDRSAGIGRTCPYRVLKMIRLREPVENHVRLEFGKHVLAQYALRPIDLLQRKDLGPRPSSAPAGKRRRMLSFTASGKATRMPGSQ